MPCSRSFAEGIAPILLLTPWPPILVVVVQQFGIPPVVRLHLRSGPSAVRFTVVAHDVDPVDVIPSGLSLMSLRKAGNSSHRGSYRIPLPPWDLIWELLHRAFIAFQLWYVGVTPPLVCPCFRRLHPQLLDVPSSHRLPRVSVTFPQSHLVTQ